MSVTLPCAAAGTVRRDLAFTRSDNVTGCITCRIALKRRFAWRGTGVVSGDNWQARETLCQALAYSVPSGDWYSLLATLNHEQAPARLHWLATLLMDALKRHHGAAQVTNVDVPGLVAELANHLSPSRLQAILGMFATFVNS